MHEGLNQRDWKRERLSNYKELTTFWLIPSPPPLSPDYKNFLVEAYKKHSTELASIEDRLNKFLLVVIGIFGAGTTAIINTKGLLTPGPARILVFAVLVLASIGWHYNSEIRSLRSQVRYLLVRCEIDMGFYSPRDRSKDLIAANKPLYTELELLFPTKGKYLRLTYGAAILAAAFGLILFIYLACPTML
jgi:hypothetical protein